MRYLQDGTHSHQPLMRLSLALTLLLLVGFWVTNFAMYFSRMSLDGASVVAYYHGSEADFRPARSAASMLETTHMHLPMMALVLLLLTHLLIFVPVRGVWKGTSIAGIFVFAILSESGGWLVRFVSPSLAPIKIAGFLGLQVGLALLLAAIALSLARPRRAPPDVTEAAPADPGAASPTASYRARRDQEWASRVHRRPETPSG
jgi:hypothetical protein